MLGTLRKFKEKGEKKKLTDARREVNKSIQNKMYLPKNKELLNDVKSLNDLFTKIGLDNIKNLFDKCQHTMPFDQFLKALNKINSMWGIMTKTGKIDELGEIFITDFTSFVHFVFRKLFADVTEDVLLRFFIPVD